MHDYDSFLYKTFHTKIQFPAKLKMIMCAVNLKHDE